MFPHHVILTYRNRQFDKRAEREMVQERHCSPCLVVMTWLPVLIPRTRKAEPLM